MNCFTLIFSYLRVFNSARRPRVSRLLILCALSMTSLAWSQSNTHWTQEDEAQMERTFVDAWMTCADLPDPDAELEHLQSILASMRGQAHDELDDAFKRARRSARLPEVIRIQTGGRYDRDQQNRKRLTEDYDDLGMIRKSALENRDTYQDDLYINMSLTAEWRLTQTRWSRDEIALRRERTALRKSEKERAKDAMHQWFSLHEARLAWCETTFDYDDDFYARSDRQERARQQRARLKIWQALSALNALTDGAYLMALLDMKEHTSPRRIDVSAP